MGRNRKSRSLAVWMNGELVGHWRIPANGGHEFLYAESWLNSPAARPLSLSMPLRPSREPYREGVEAYFDNLLPDSKAIREKIQRRFQIGSSDSFDLLQEIGRDCVGAIQLLDENAGSPQVKKIEAVKLTHREIERLLESAFSPALGQLVDDDTFRISIAGAQEKTALLWHEGAWHRPQGSTPTTHIMKLPMGMTRNGIDLTTSVENEWLCAQIVRGYGCANATCRIERFGEFRVLVVERFDRRLAPNGTWWMRLPQEDMCQATGTPAGLKYESDGGPGIRRISELLLASERATDRQDFIRSQLIFWLLAAIDGHAKNFSIFLLPGGAFRLTPLYDILSAHPMLGHGRNLLAPEKVKMAMAVEGKTRHYHWSKIQAHHWGTTAKMCGVAKFEKIMEQIIEQTPQVLEDVEQQIPSGFPVRTAETIIKGVSTAVKRLANEITHQ